MSETSNRKRVIAAMVVVPAVVAGTLAVGLPLAASQSSLGGDPITGQPLVEPPVLKSRNGRLAVTIDARTSIVSIGGRKVATWAYDAMTPGPTLEVFQGDDLQITSRNNLPAQPTNLHTHGLHVSPEKQADNIFVDTPSGATFTNKYDIPDDHIPGEYWYHPHRHMFSSDQLSMGMAGIIDVRADTPEERALDRYRTRQMIIQSFRVDGGQVVKPGQPSSARPALYINGQLEPVVAMRPGEIQRWRLTNVQANVFARVAIPTGMKAWLISTDGNPTSRPIPVSDMLIPPAGRRAVLVRASSPGDLTVATAPWGPGIQAVPRFNLFTARVGGTPVTGSTLPVMKPSMPDLRREAVHNSRNVEFSAGPPLPGSTAKNFMINGMNYDQWGSRNLFSMKLDTVEEWTLTNVTDEYHPFHIHIQPFQVVSVNGKPVSGVDYRDTVPIPPMENGVPGTVVIRQKFTDFTGRFVFHCHILFHEDNGMMAPVRVVRAGAGRRG